MMRAEEKLPIEVGHVDGVQVDDFNVLEPGEHKVLQQFTPCPHGNATTRNEA